MRKSIVVVVLLLVLVEGVVLTFVWSSRDQVKVKKALGNNDGQRGPEQLENKVKANGGASTVANPLVSSKVKVNKKQVGTPFKWTGPELSGQLKFVLGLDSQDVSQARMDAIHKLGKNLDAMEVEALTQFVKCKYRYDQDLSAVKNDILDALLKQQTLPPSIQQDLLSMFRDKEYEQYWRDYCVQHFEVFCRCKWPVGYVTEVSDSDHRDLQKAYQEALDEYDSSIAGTALLGLERLSSDYSEYDKSWIADKALSIASTENADLRSRIAAVQVAGKLGKADLLPLARKLATSTESIPLRMSAIAAVGTIGEREDVNLLTDAGKSGNEYVKNAAIAALQTLHGRLDAVKP